MQLGWAVVCMQMAAYFNLPTQPRSAFLSQGFTCSQRSILRRHTDAAWKWGELTPLGIPLNQWGMGVGGYLPRPLVLRGTILMNFLYSFSQVLSWIYSPLLTAITSSVMYSLTFASFPSYSPCFPIPAPWDHLPHNWPISNSLFCLCFQRKPNKDRV